MAFLRKRKYRTLAEREIAKLVPFDKHMIGQKIYIKVEINGKLETVAVGALNHYCFGETLPATEIGYSGSLTLDLGFTTWKGFVNERS